VTDTRNYRVLHYSGTSTTADRVYGQAGSFATATYPTRVSADTCLTPYFLAVDIAGGLYVADGSRVLHFAPGSTLPDRVYGQGGSFTSNANNRVGLNANSLGGACSLAAESGGGLYIVDCGNNRVLHYPGVSPTSPGKPLITPGGIGPLYSSATTIQLGRGYRSTAPTSLARSRHGTMISPGR
jgi:hypothetical protein